MEEISNYNKTVFCILLISVFYIVTIHPFACNITVNVDWSVDWRQWSWMIDVWTDDLGAASCAIVKFLEIESTEELSNGWMLLCTINLLSMGNDNLIDSMTVASLPSTLVKCLYLFFDLPDIDHPDTLQPGCEFTPRESRVLLQKVFVQVDFIAELCTANHRYILYLYYSSNVVPRVSCVKSLKTVPLSMSWSSREVVELEQLCW